MISSLTNSSDGTPSTVKPAASINQVSHSGDLLAHTKRIDAFYRNDFKYFLEFYQRSQKTLIKVSVLRTERVIYY